MKQIIIIDWYDTLKGIGEGKTEDGTNVFLNSHYVISSGWKGLNDVSKVKAEIKKNEDGSFYAVEIEKEL